MEPSDESVKVRRVRVRLSAQNLDQVASSFKANLSPGGVFLKVPKDLKTKDAVSVEILLADRTRFLAGHGRVTWVGEPSAQGLRGVSCEVSWDSESQPRVNEILSRTTIPPPAGEPTRGSLEQHVTVDSLPAPAPAPTEAMDTEDVTETNRAPDLSVASTSTDLVPPLEQAVTLEEGAESPLAPGFISPPATNAAEEPPHQEEDLTMESSAPDFAAWAAGSVPPGEAESSTEGTGDEQSAGEGEAGQKPGVWRWIKKRFGSNA